MVTALTKHINFAAFSKGYSTIDNENILFASLITITHTHTHTLYSISHAVIISLAKLFKILD